MFGHPKKQPQLRVGIYAGTFNPVHTGHIAFALQSIKTAKLDMVYFLPERRPRHKKGVEHFAHRVAMLKAAVRPHPQLTVLETDDVSFTVQRTLPKLQDQFSDSQLVFLMGSDIVPHIASWPLAHRLFEQAELVVGMRKDDELADILALAQTWSPQPIKLTLLQSYAPDVSSHKVREALAGRQYAKGLLTSVARYSEHHWLYVSLSKVLLDKA